MLKIKSLNWITRADGVVHADPIGLQYSYYIMLNEDVKYELALIENNGSYDAQLCTTFDSIELAKKHAHQHYTDIVLSFFNFSENV